MCNRNLILYAICFKCANSMKYTYYILINDRYVTVFHYLNKLDLTICILFHVHNSKVMSKLKSVKNSKRETFESNCYRNCYRVYKFRNKTIIYNSLPLRFREMLDLINSIDLQSLIANVN